MSSYTRAFCALLILSCACAGNASDGAEADGIDDSFLAPEGAADAWGVTEGAPEAKGVLRAANELTAAGYEEAGVQETAVNALVAFRTGKDGKLGTADDVIIETLLALDAIPYVGPQTFASLYAYAMNAGWLQSTAGASIKPLADASLARVVVVFPRVDGVLVKAPVSLDGATMQASDDEIAFDVDPASKACLILTTDWLSFRPGEAPGTFSYCNLSLQANTTTRVELAAAFVGDFLEPFTINLGWQPVFSIRDASTTTENPYVWIWPTLAQPVNRYVAMFPMSYVVADTGNPPLTALNVTLKPGEIYKTSLLPLQDFRAFVWRTGDPATLPDASPNSRDVALLKARGDDQKATLEPLTAKGDGKVRTAAPIIYVARGQYESATASLSLDVGPCRFPHVIGKIAEGQSVSFRSRRIDVADVTVNDPSAPGGVRTIPGKFQVWRDDGRTCNTWFKTGTGIDVPPGQYHVTVTSTPIDLPVKTEYDIDLR